MAARLPLLGALVVIAAACGTEAITPQDGAAPESARSETVWRVTGGDGRTHEFRWTGIDDFARDRSISVDGETGCRSISIGEVSYSEFPPGDGMPEGKRWVSSGGEAVETDSEQLFEQSQEPQSDAEGSMTSTHIMFGFPEPPPHEYLDHLREQSGELELVGEEDVRGVPTRRYSATLDLKQLMRERLEAASWRAVNVERYLETMDDTEEQIEIWVDADGLARRVVTTTDSEAADLDFGHGSVSTTEYFDFGVETSIKAPPAAEVIESDEWQRLTEERMKEQMEEERRQVEEGVAPLPGAFEPSVTPSCLH